MLNLVAKLADILGLQVTSQDVEPRETQDIKPEALDVIPTEDQTRRAMGNVKEMVVERDKNGKERIAPPSVQKQE